MAIRHGVQLRLNDVPAVTRKYPYYALPNEYQGNQLKSYGGSIKYQVEYQGRGPSNEAPDIIIEGNNITLTYRHPSRLLPNTKNIVNAQLTANNWYKLDGSYASREDIMMALADVTHILIKLQYVDGEERNVELLHILMDSAALRDFGLGSANLVEECKCPAGYKGLSCEECDSGYVRQRSGAWLGRCAREEDPCRPGTYGDPNRGIQCKPCPCPVAGNSHARSCTLGRNNEPICNCDVGYYGDRCEQCAQGYEGNPLTREGCHPVAISRCNPDGTERSLPDRCECKQGVTGLKCDQCTVGSFFLNPRGGCISCFCMGVTEQCSSTNWFRDSVKSTIGNNHDANIALVEGHDDPREMTEALLVENREVIYRNFGTSEETFYWSLPSSFLGNKITAYGGNLAYTVRYTPMPSGSSSKNNSPDVVIHSGNKITLHHYRRDGGVSPRGLNTYVVPIFEDVWHHYDDGTPANRQHLLMSLADVTAIYIKATYTTVSREAALSQVTLDIANEENYGFGKRAWEVEQCTCPYGHQGLSCEDCSPGYYKSESGLYLGLCELCECNGHSDECDAQTGACMVWN